LVPGYELEEAATAVSAVAVQTVVVHVAEVGAAARGVAAAAGSASAGGSRAVEGAGFASGGGVEEAETCDASVEEVAEWPAAEAAIQTVFGFGEALAGGQAEGTRVVVMTVSVPPYRLASGGYVLVAEDMETVARRVAYPGHN
jgi:hypothetical protein